MTFYTAHGDVFAWLVRSTLGCGACRGIENTETCALARLAPLTPRACYTHLGCHPSAEAQFASRVKSRAHMSSLNDLEFAYAPVRDQVRDLREYL